MSEGQVIAIQSVDQWKEQIQKSIDHNILVVVDFTASWCGPCRFIAPVFALYAKEKSSAIYLKVDVDELKSIVEEFKIEAMPTFVFLKEGQEVDRVVGARKEELDEKLLKHVGVMTASG